MNTKITAASLGKTLTRHGLFVNADASGLSSSRYLTVALDGDGAPSPLKIRIATHGARPTYEALNGAADIEVGPHQSAHTDSAAIAAMMALYHFVVSPDASLRAALARLRTRRANAEAVKQAALDREVAREDRAAAERAELDRRLEASGYVRADYTGRQWREMRRKFR